MTPDKSVNNGVTADNVSTNSKPNKLTCNAGNTNIAIESAPEAYNVGTELERTVRSVSSDSDSSNDELHVYRNGFCAVGNSKTEEHEDYKALYDDAKRELEVQAEKHVKDVTNLKLQFEKEKNDHQIWRKKYNALEVESKDHFEDMKTYYESAVVEKDKQIVSQRKTMDDYDERLCKMISKEGIGVPCDHLNKQSNNNENFCMKPKRKGPTSYM